MADDTRANRAAGTLRAEGPLGARGPRSPPRTTESCRSGAMSKTLVVVESPAKAKTIEKYPGRRLRRPGFVRPHPGPAQERSRRRRRQRLRGHLRGRQTRRSTLPTCGRLASGGRPDPGDGLRPGGRGDRLPRGLAPRDRTVRGQAGHVHRDHAGRDPRGLRPPARGRPQAVRRAGGPAGPRPARRLQDLAAALAPGPARPIGRPRPVGRPAPDRRARARDPGVRAVEYWSVDARLRRRTRSSRSSPDW